MNQLSGLRQAVGTRLVLEILHIGDHCINGLDGCFWAETARGGLLHEVVRCRLNGFQVAIDVPLCRAEHFSVSFIWDLWQDWKALAGGHLTTYPGKGLFE